MARKGVLNAENLAALGPDRLASLLMELAGGDTTVRKRLVLAVAETSGPGGVIKAVDRRLSALATARGHIEWEKARAFAAELDGLRRSIAESLTPRDPAAAADRLERLLGLGPRLIERVDDSDGRIGAVLERAVADLGAAWTQISSRDPDTLAEKVLGLVVADQYGVYDEMIAAATPALGEVGLLALGDLARKAFSEKPPPAKARSFNWRRTRLQQVLAEVADARGDVDGFIAVQTAENGGPVNTRAIAGRLLDANRPDEALSWLDKETARPGLRVMTYADLEARSSPPERPAGLDWERETLRIRALEMLGRRDEAQDSRWRLFEHTLHPDLLRSYLKVLPDFEDDAALDRAFALASTHASALMGLSFLIRWPNLRLAAELVSRRADALDGRDYEILNPAAEALGERHPLAATLLHRRLIDSVLERAASKSYPYAARNLAACAALADVVDWSAAASPSHDQYVADLRARHGRKSGFWSIVS